MKTDLPLLNAVLEHAEDLDDETLKAFTEWRNRLQKSPSGMATISPRQRSWLRAVARRLDVVEPAVNEWSERSPAEREQIKGVEVPTPEVLRRLPLKPPGRGGAVRVVEDHKP